MNLPALCRWCLQSLAVVRYWPYCETCRNALHREAVEAERREQFMSVAEMDRAERLDRQENERLESWGAGMVSPYAAPTPLSTSEEDHILAPCSMEDCNDNGDR